MNSPDVMPGGFALSGFPSGGGSPIASFFRLLDVSASAQFAVFPVSRLFLQPQTVGRAGKCESACRALMGRLLPIFRFQLQPMRPRLRLLVLSGFSVAGNT